MNTDTEKLVALRAAVKHAMHALQAMGETEEGVNCAYSGLSVALDQTATETPFVTPAVRLDRMEREIAAIRMTLT